MANVNEFSQPIKLLNGGPLDAWAGPYESIAAANAAIANVTDAGGKNLREGKSVLVNGIVYFWQAPFLDTSIYPSGAYQSQFNHSHLFVNGQKRVIANTSTGAYNSGDGYVVPVGQTGNGSYISFESPNLDKISKDFDNDIIVVVEFITPEIAQTITNHAIRWQGSTSTLLAQKITHDYTTNGERYQVIEFIVPKNSEGVTIISTLENSVAVSAELSITAEINVKYKTRSIVEERKIGGLINTSVKNNVFQSYELITSSELNLRNNRYMTFPAVDLYGTLLRLFIYPEVSGYSNGAFELYFRINETKNSTFNATSYLLNALHFDLAGEVLWVASKTVSTIFEDARNKVIDVRITANASESVFKFEDKRLSLNFLVNSHVTITDSYNIEIYDVYYGLAKDVNVEDVLETKISSIENKLQGLNDKLGNYLVQIKDAMTSVEVVKSVGTLQSKGLGYMTTAGQSGVGNKIIINIDASDFISIPAAEIDIRMSYVGNQTDTFNFIAYDSSDNKIAVLNSYLDANNSMYRATLPVAVYGLCKYKIVVECKTASSVGFSLYFLAAQVRGILPDSTVQKRLSLLESSSRSLTVIGDDNKPYTIKVVGGVLQAALSYFSKMLVLGHSFVHHGELPAIGWHGDWGMAASARQNDFTNKLHKELSTYNSALQLLPIVSMTDFEINHQSPSYDYSQWDYLADYQADLIVVKIGENVTVDTDLSSHLIKLIDEHILKGNKATVVIASMWITSSDTSTNVTGRNIELKKVADHYNSFLVMINDNSRQYTAWDTPLPALPDGSQPDKGIYPTGWGAGDVTESNRRVIERVVGGHPGDAGHAMIASKFFEEIKRVYNLS